MSDDKPDDKPVLVFTNQTPPAKPDGKNSDIAIAQQLLASKMLKLTVSLLRFTAGGGPNFYDFREHVEDMLNAYLVHKKLDPQGLPHAMPNFTEWARDEYELKTDDAFRWAKEAEEAVLQRALRVVAARLNGQRTQETTETHKLRQAMRGYVDEWQKACAPPPPPPKKKKR